WTKFRLLYTLVIKRMMNQGGVLRKHFDSPDLPLREDLDLGWTPKSLTDDQLQLFVDRLCGPNMGKNPNKGKTYRWIPNHLQDGNGRVLPRSMVRLFELAAEIESDHQKAEWPTLLHHTSLRAAIERVSESRVQELEEEFPWIKSVRTALQQKKPEVPIVRTKLQSLLEIEWGDTGDRPPETSGRELLKILLDLGVFYLRTDDSRVDVRDLYLKGFGLWRRGGVAQPTSVKRG
ncbi:MAG: hypothetical protein NT069_23385, partial [Planctomycetota bacterium]|nr:hypothetical protein [Planctomycetota bacterium]